MAFLRLKKFGRRPPPRKTVPKQKQTPKLPVQLSLFEASSLIRIDPKLDPAHQAKILEHINKGSNSMIRVAVFDLSTIFGLLVNKAKASSEVQLWNIDGVEFTATPKRLYAFFQHANCVRCSAKAVAFYVERHINEDQPLYLNLYGIRKDGTMNLMTCDHILPDSFGGRYHMDNFQTMCTTCNGTKANHMSNKEIERVLTNVNKYAKDWVDKTFITHLLQLHLVVNKEQDKKVASQLRNSLQRYIKSIAHSTKAVQYTGMTAEMDKMLREYQKRKRMQAIKSWLKSVISRTASALTFGVVKPSLKG